jgi:hypothetical protein
MRGRDRRRLQKSSRPFKTGHPERWPSGLRRTLGKRVCGKPYRGFESHSLRHAFACQASCNGKWFAELVLSRTATVFATRVISSYGRHAPQQACRVRLFVERCDPRLSLHLDCRRRPPLVRQAAEDCLSGPRCDRRVRQAIMCYSWLFSLPQRCLAEFGPGLGRF